MTARDAIKRAIEMLKEGMEDEDRTMIEDEIIEEGLEALKQINNY